MMKKIKSKKCKACGESFVYFSSLQKVCSVSCSLKHVRKEADKEFKRETKRRRENIKSRSEWYDDLQVLVNRYVRLRDADKPCCTCNKTNDVKYDAGHFLSRGAFPELRFELTNIHKQCSVNCNQHGSGMRKEYEDFIVATYGKAQLIWLKGPHKLLKDRFPHIDDIKVEIKRFRELIKSLNEG